MVTIFTAYGSGSDRYPVFASCSKKLVKAVKGLIFCRFIFRDQHFLTIFSIAIEFEKSKIDKMVYRT